MLHELFITHCTNGTSIMNPFTFKQGLSNVFIFLLEYWLVCADHPCPMCQGVVNDIFSKKKWLPSQWRYWSVWVVYLYTDVVKVLLGSGETRLSRKDKAPSFLESSLVNWMCGSWEVICWRSCRQCSAC